MSVLKESTSKKSVVLTLIPVLAGLAVSCSPNAHDSSASSPTSTAIDSRSADDNVLGNVSADGLCDPAVIDIDHEKNTPDITYHGQPGDKVLIDILMDDGTVVHQTFELSESTTSMMGGSSVYNGDIDRISVSASGSVGQSGTCTIQVS